MNAGLPGTGIGGLFYIAGALWMPVGSVVRWATGRSHGHSWRKVALQGGIALGILAALWATGWAVGYLVALTSPAVGLAGGAADGARRVTSVVRWVTLAGSTGILLLLLSVVQVLRFSVPRARPAATTPALVLAPDLAVEPCTALPAEPAMALQEAS
jgi:hypothetical protein